MATYYISSTSGNDENVGTSASAPWKTLDRLHRKNGTTRLVVLKPGDRVKLKRGDVFEGQHIVSSDNGASGSPITYEAYANSDGSDNTSEPKPVIRPMSTLTGTWTATGNGSYWIPLGWNPNIVTINDDLKERGLYPRVTPNTYEQYVSAGASSYIRDSAMTSASDWKNAKAVIRISAWQTHKYTITSQSTATDGTKFYFSSSNTGNANYGYWFTDHPRVVDPNFNKTGIKDGDWVYDAVADRLYVYAPSGMTGKTVRVSRTGTNSATGQSYDFGIFVLHQYLSFKNLVIEGAGDRGFRFSYAGHYSVVDSCDFINCNYGIHLNATHNSVTIQNCNFTNITNTGIEAGTKTNGVIVRNCNFENVGIWNGMMNNGGSSVGSSIYYIGRGLTMQKCRMKNMGYAGVVFRLDDSLIEDCWVDNYCVTKSDTGGYYTWSSADVYGFTLDATSLTFPTAIGQQWTIPGAPSTMGDQLSIPGSTLYNVGHKVMIRNTYTPWMWLKGTVASYTNGGNMVVNVTEINKTPAGGFYGGTASTWKITSLELPKNRTIRRCIATNASNPPGAKSGQAHGIYLDDETLNLLIEDCVVDNVDGHGIFFHHTANITTRRTIVTNAKRHGVQWEYYFSNRGRFIESCSIENSVINVPNNDGYVLNFYSSDPGPASLKRFSNNKNNYYRSDLASNANIHYEYDYFKQSSTSAVRKTVGLTDWNLFTGIEDNSIYQQVSSTAPALKIEYNTGTSSRTISLGSTTYTNLLTRQIINGGSITLQPYESIALVQGTLGGVVNPPTDPVIPTISLPSLSSTTLGIASVTASSLTLSWTQAATTLSPSTLTYYVYASTANNITTLATTEANGTLVGIAKNTSSLSISNLEPSTTYYFNIVVSDELGNKSLYAAKSQTTSAASQLMPVPGGSQDTWGTVLNSYLLVSHNTDGTLKASSIASKLFGTSNTTNIDILGELRVQQAITLSSQYNQSLLSTTASSVTPLNFTNGTVKVVLTTNTILLLGNAVPGGTYTLILQQDGTGGRSITWPPYVKWTNNTVPTISTGANAVTVITFVYDGVSFFGKLGNI
jgi:hypothetical protein